MLDTVHETLVTPPGIGYCRAHVDARRGFWGTPDAGRGGGWALVRAAKFPTVKSLDSFEFKAIPSLSKVQVLELARCEWIERRENVIALGPSGTGKTHVAQGLGLAACQRGLSVRFGHRRGARA